LFRSLLLYFAGCRRSSRDAIQLRTVSLDGTRIQLPRVFSHLLVPSRRIGSIKLWRTDLGPRLGCVRAARLLRKRRAEAYEIAQKARANLSETVREFSSMCNGEAGKMILKNCWRQLTLSDALQCQLVQVQGSGRNGGRSRKVLRVRSRPICRVGFRCRDSPREQSCETRVNGGRC
jgi:hypothetical protein